MSRPPQTIWCNNDFTAAHQTEQDLLAAGIGSRSLLMFAPDQDGRAGKARDALLNTEIAFGFPDATAVAESLKIRWVQLNAAGYTSFDNPDIRETLTARGIVITNSSDVYAEPCAEHLLAMMCSISRGLPAALDSQRGDRAWLMLQLRPTLPLLSGQTVLILGFGAIARRLVELLQPFKMNIIAVRRAIKGDEGIRVVTPSELNDCFPLADHLVNILPANDESANFLNAERLARLKPGAIVYNIGRGTTLDQEALMNELRAGHLAAAYLDVTNPEPLPSDHPLWSTPNCYITPHVGGGHRNEKLRQVRHFLENLRRFESGEPLRNRVI